MQCSSVKGPRLIQVSDQWSNCQVDFDAKILLEHLSLSSYTKEKPRRHKVDGSVWNLTNPILKLQLNWLNFLPLLFFLAPFFAPKFLEELLFFISSAIQPTIYLVGRTTLICV